jgi:hypothetical protein
MLKAYTFQTNIDSNGILPFSYLLSEVKLPETSCIFVNFLYTVLMQILFFYAIIANVPLPMSVTTIFIITVDQTECLSLWSFQYNKVRIQSLQMVYFHTSLLGVG